MIGIETLKENLRISTNDLCRVLLLAPIDNNNMTAPNGLIKKMELEISARMYIDTERASNAEYNNNRRLSSRLSRDQPKRINFRSRSHLRMRLSERNPVIVIHSYSETETELESETPSVGCPKSVRDRMRCLLEPQIREQIRREMKQQLRREIRREIEPQLRDQIRRELEPRLNVQIQREMEPQLRAQIRHEIEPLLLEQIRREITPLLGVQIHRERSRESGNKFVEKFCQPEIILKMKFEKRMSIGHGLTSFSISLTSARLMSH